ncbi:MAG: hypothetical protein GQ569_05650 [Methylococcaceae bacterium]|nr:hypothetical protein [Methylococcaceae bacterium]
MINQTVGINNALKTIESLSLDEQSYLVDVINRRLHDLKRNQLADSVKKAELDYQQGNTQSGSVDDLFSVLDDD